jgi:hypothetical protein
MSGFRTSLLHSCFSPNLNEPQPKTCKCRKLVTREKAIQLVEQGECVWITDYKGEVPIPTWNICYSSRYGKTPRGHTLEKAHMERSLERRDTFPNKYMTDEGAMAKNMEAAALGDFEQMELFELYHDLEIMERYNLFRGMNHEDDKGAAVNDLYELKKFSDTFGTVEGKEGTYVTEIITSRADQLKSEHAVDDPYEGRTLFPMIGFNQRTKC